MLRRFAGVSGFVAAIAVVAAADPPPPTLSADPAALGADIAATVDGEPIRLADVDAAVRAALPGVPLTPHQWKGLRPVVLRDLIDDVLLRQFLDREGPPLDPAELDAQLKVFVEQLARQNRTLADYLRQTGRTEARFRADWALQMRLAEYVRRHTTEEQLRAYHAAHRDHFDGVEVRLAHILLRVGRGATPDERAAVRTKAEALRAELAAGRVDFAAAARAHSQCPTAAAGGDLGYVGRRPLLPQDEPLARAAFALKVGELSDVVETEYGFHILRVTDRKPGTPREYEACAADVLETYTDDFRERLLARLRKQAQVRVTLP